MMTALNTATQMVMFIMSMVRNLAVVVKQETLDASHMATSDKNVTNR